MCYAFIRCSPPCCSQIMIYWRGRGGGGSSLIFISGNISGDFSQNVHNYVHKLQNQIFPLFCALSASSDAPSYISAGRDVFMRYG